MNQPPGEGDDEHDEETLGKAVLFVSGESHRSFHAEHFVPAWAMKGISKEKTPGPLLDFSVYDLTVEQPKSWRQKAEDHGAPTIVISGAPCLSFSNRSGYYKPESQGSDFGELLVTRRWLRLAHHCSCSWHAVTGRRHSQIGC